MTLSPKHLNFDEMWKVHLLYKKGNHSVIDVANFLYPKRQKMEFSELLVNSINGLNYNNYPLFLNFIKGFTRDG
jgi:hypothetical protein